MSNPYLRSKVMTASPAQLVLMLYDGAIRFNQQAIRCFDEDRARDALTPMSRALRIVQELQATLDPRQAPELCEQLERLYVFVEDQILKAQQEHSPQPLRDAERILRDLRGAWAELLSKGADVEAGPIRRAG